jgi:hypothetical protein
VSGLKYWKNLSDLPGWSGEGVGCAPGVAGVEVGEVGLELVMLPGVLASRLLPADGAGKTLEEGSSARPSAWLCQNCAERV